MSSRAALAGANSQTPTPFFLLALAVITTGALVVGLGFCVVGVGVGFLDGTGAALVGVTLGGATTAAVVTGGGSDCWVTTTAAAPPATAVVDSAAVSTLRERLKPTFAATCLALIAVPVFAAPAIAPALAAP